MCLSREFRWLGLQYLMLKMSECSYPKVGVCMLALICFKPASEGESKTMDGKVLVQCHCFAVSNAVATGKPWAFVMAAGLTLGLAGHST